MVREIGEEADAGGGVQLVAADEGLEGEAGLVRGNALAQARFEVRVLAEGVEFSREQLIEIGLGVFWQMHDDRSRREIAEALRVAVQQTGRAADQVEERELIDEAHEVAHHDLVEAEAQSFGVGDAQFAEPLAERLAAPEPFERDVVASRDDEVGNDEDAAR